MNTDQKQFIELALKHQVLKLGDFTLKSGYKSVYFFNLGEFHDGEALIAMADAYAHLIQTHFKNQFDVLFGPSYKGVPLATAIAMRLMEKYGINVEVCFNRKEPKPHGEGGLLMGASLQGKRILVVDDVISMGTALDISMKLINEAGGHCVGVAIAMDRQEKLPNDPRTPLQRAQEQYGMPIKAIITAETLVSYCLIHSELMQLAESIERQRHHHERS